MQPQFENGASGSGADGKFTYVSLSDIAGGDTVEASALGQTQLGQLPSGWFRLLSMALLLLYAWYV